MEKLTPRPGRIVAPKGITCPLQHLMPLISIISSSSTRKELFIYQLLRLSKEQGKQDTSFLKLMVLYYFDSFCSIPSSTFEICPYCPYYGKTTTLAAICCKTGCRRRWQITFKSHGQWGRRAQMYRFWQSPFHCSESPALPADGPPGIWWNGHRSRW